MGFSEGSTISKARLVRQAAQENPELKPREIAAILQKQGHQITAQYVSKTKPKGSRQDGAKNDRKLVSFLKKADKFLVFVTGQPTIEIPFKRCNSSADVIEHIWTLTQTEGIKIKHIAQFIKVYAEVSGILPVYLR